MRTLGVELAGAGVVRWDGLDESGHQAASGVFLFALEPGAARITRKLALLS
ncbi:MAG: hypothetical protein FJY95_01650 [Candidatus Handelsmanbacteria bacterium]|nr:hypothetical protein [Candidatus Handelsmanbacteria bacterium]